VPHHRNKRRYESARAITGCEPPPLGSVRTEGGQIRGVVKNRHKEMDSGTVVVKDARWYRATLSGHQAE